MTAIMTIRQCCGSTHETSKPKLNDKILPFLTHLLIFQHTPLVSLTLTLYTADGFLTQIFCYAIMNFERVMKLTDEEKILFRKIKDMINKSEKTFSVVYSHFLTPAEQMFLKGERDFLGILGFEGGYEDAERRVCRVCTNEYNSDEGVPIVLYSVRAKDKNAVISHRDVLGALMGLGIKREMTGDIIADGNKAQFFCHKSVSEFVKMNLDKIGRYSVEVSESEFSEMAEVPKKPVNINVSSMRLDSIVGEGFGVSRTKAAALIKKGMVFVNWQECIDVSREAKAGDKISLHGRGKICVSGISGVSKKGRLFVDILVYV